MIQRILLFITIIFVVLALGIFLPFKWLEPALHFSGYYFILTTFFVWAALLLKILYPKITSSLKTHYPAIILSIGLMCLIFYAIPPKFKILADEANLVGVSKAMYENKTVSLPVQGLGLDYSVFNYSQKMDKRPFLFPFLISLSHTIFGYSPYNGFIVNFILGFSILLLMYLLINWSFSKFYGIIGIIVLASFPTFVFWVTSSGFDILNLFFILFFFGALLQFTLKQNADEAELLFLSLVLLAQCRYESFIFFIVLFVMAPYFINREIILKYRFISCIFPFFLLPVIWQRRLFLEFFDSVRINHYLYENADQVFNFSHLTSNFSKNIFVLLGMDSRFGFLPIISILAIIGGYLIIKQYTIKNDFDVISRKFVSLCIICIISLFLIHSLYYWGSYTKSVSNRFALIFVPFFIFSALYFIYYIVKRPNRYIKNIIILLAFIQLLYYWPIASKQWIIQKLSLSYEYQKIINSLHSIYNVSHDKLLIISDLPNLYVIQNVGSIDFDHANKYKNKIDFFSRTYYDHIIVLQRHDLKSNQPNNNNVLAPNFQLTQVARVNISQDFYIKISEINDIL